MKLFYAFVVFSLMLTSCTGLIKLTANEDKGVKDILNFYGGYCEYSIGITASTNDKTKKFFELKLGKSDVAEQFSDAHEFPAYGIAYMFYNDLKSEQKNYDEIRGIVVFNNGQTCQVSLSTDTLKLITAKMKVLNEVVDLIKEKKFDNLIPLLNSDSFTDSAKTNLISNLKKVDPSFGNVKGFYLYGFRFETYNGYNVLNILGVLIRDKQNSQLSLKIDLKESDDKIHFLDYTWFPKN